MILGRRATLVFLAATLISYTTILVVQLTGRMPQPLTITTPVTQWISLSALFVLVFVLIDLATNSLRQSAYEARASQAQVQQANLELERLSHDLEARVAERTRQLELRSAQQQTAAEVVRILATERDLESLLKQMTRLLAERFNFYHVGVFLVEPENPGALILRAANSPGGQRMLERGHRLSIPLADSLASGKAGSAAYSKIPTGIVGKAAAARQTHIAMQVEQDNEFYNNPDLPETRSEMALPLVIQSGMRASGSRSTGQLLGVLDVQSRQAEAFSQDDINLLQIVADQISVAIENARLFAENQLAVQSLQKAYGEVSGQAWEKLLKSRRAPAYLVQRTGVQQSGAPGAVQVSQPGNQWQPAMQQAYERGDLVQSGAHLSAPVKIRGQVIGAIELRKTSAALAGQPGEDAPRLWTQEEVDFLQTLNEQLGVALESARLYEETRKRAERERLTGEITAKMRASNDPKEILQTAVLELRKALRVPHAQAVVGTPSGEARQTPGAGPPDQNDPMEGSEA